MPGARRNGKVRAAERQCFFAMTPAPPDPSLPSRLRGFHARLPLAGDPPNAVLSLPDDRVLSPPRHAAARAGPRARGVAGVPRFLLPHGVFPLLAYRLRAWPADCRPPLEVTAWLNRASSTRPRG